MIVVVVTVVAVVAFAAFAARVTIPQKGHDDHPTR